MKEKVTIKNCTLYLGDCLDIIPSINNINVVVTDPNYGVNLGLVKNGHATKKRQRAYTVPDTPEYVKKVCVSAIKLCIEKYKRVVVTPGNRNLWSYPQPDDLGCWFNPAACSFGRWGFNLMVTPIIYYGKDPRLGKTKSASSTWGQRGNENLKDINHPCPKPLKFTKWLVNKASLEGESVLDCFMGSGTTGIACVLLNRKFIGIEIEPKYFYEACERIERSYDQMKLFEPVYPVYSQGSFFV